MLAPQFKKLTFLLPVTICTLFACNNATKTVHTQPNEFPTKNINAAEDKPLDVAPYVKDIKYIPLEAQGESLFSEIDKLMIRGNHIYVLDLTGLPYLYVFELSGKFVKRIGKRGFGPGEYAKLTDFDIDTAGHILLYDRQRMQMLKFDIGGNLLGILKTPFRADGFSLLNNGKYIFSLDKESAQEKTAGNKIVVTDSTFRILSEMLPYNQDFSDDKATPALFSASKEGLLYNKAVNDSLFLFDTDGKIIKSYFMDFGTHTVPQKLKDSYFDLAELRAKNTYHYMYKKPFLIKDHIIGNMYQGNQRALFLYDGGKNSFQTKLLQASDLSHLNINLPMTTIGDSVIVSYLSYDILSADHDKKDLDTSLVNHIEQKNNGTVIMLYTLK